MSNFIFPTLVLQGGSRGWLIKKGPVFSTTVNTPASKRGELRVSTTPFCLWEFEMTFPLLQGKLNDPTSFLAKVVGFYAQMQGQANDWLYDDPYDDTIPASAPAAFGVGDGVTTAFQLTRPIGGYNDIIQKLNGAPIIYNAGVATTAFTITALGVVTFNSAPASGNVLSWSGQFYFRCRFLKDALDQLRQIAPNFSDIQTLEWISVIL